MGMEPGWTEVGFVIFIFTGETDGLSQSWRKEKWDLDLTPKSWPQIAIMSSMAYPGKIQIVIFSTSGKCPSMAIMCLGFETVSQVSQAALKIAM